MGVREIFVIHGAGALSQYVTSGARALVFFYYPLVLANGRTEFEDG